MLGDQPDDEIDDALLAPAFLAVLGFALLILDDAGDVLGHESHDGIDDALLVEIAMVTIAIPIAIAVVVVAMVIAVIAVALAAAIAAAGTPPPAVRPHQPFEVCEPLENFTPIVVTHVNPQFGCTPVD